MVALKKQNERYVKRRMSAMQIVGQRHGETKEKADGLCSRRLERKKFPCGR